MECKCSEEHASDASRDRYGVELHSPYCPVGRAEREAGKALVPPWGSQKAEED